MRRSISAPHLDHKKRRGGSESTIGTEGSWTPGPDTSGLRGEVQLMWTDGSCSGRCWKHAVENGSTRRVDILAYNADTKQGIIADPTIRFEVECHQSAEVHLEKKSIYEPTVNYFKLKYALIHVEVFGLLIGARGTIPAFFEEFRREFALPTSLRDDIVIILFSTFCVNVKIQYTLNQRLFLVKQYWITNSITLTQMAYQREFGVRNPPKRNTILGLINKLETTGSLVSEKGKHRSSRLPTVVVDVRARLEQSPKKSLRRLSQETGYTYSMCQRA
ncbi:hypothetical protein ANN_26464 [Periplaneta americana]|uniref:DUF4817 domain-containing protein n=1 Tax=Periplaneta americana TaxID=6978 RepID=A0ABQ8RY64_PERAM|nr:hypothetical protein ANN_26464 [Periplaneta americana]